MKKLLISTFCICTIFIGKGQTLDTTQSLQPFKTRNLLTKKKQTVEKYKSVPFAYYDFRVKTDNIKEFPDGFIPCVNLYKPKRYMQNLEKSDEIIIPESDIKIIIDYPLKHPAHIYLQSKNGFTRAKLYMEIAKNYHEIYTDEKKTSPHQKRSKSKIKNIYGRNPTYGIYGIWGSDLRDLSLSNIKVLTLTNDEIIVGLKVGNYDLSN